MYEANGSSRGSPHSSHSVIVSGNVGSLMVETMSTKGTSAIAPAKVVGERAIDAPTVRPPALPPRTTIREGEQMFLLAKCSAQAMVSKKVFFLERYFPLRYQSLPISPPPRGCASAQMQPRSNSDSRATENHGATDISYAP